GRRDAAGECAGSTRGAADDQHGRDVRFRIRAAASWTPRARGAQYSAARYPRTTGLARQGADSRVELTCRAIPNSSDRASPPVRRLLPLPVARPCILISDG